MAPSLRMVSALLAVSLCQGCATVSDPTEGGATVWIGEASAPSERTGLSIRLSGHGEDLSATMSLPNVGVSEWPAADVRRQGRTWTLAFQSDSGTQTMTLMRQGDALNGVWSEPGQLVAARVTLRLAPQDAPLQEQLIVITGPAGAIGASIIVPRGEGPFPGVVLLHGSGPQPRDASRFAAQALARRGIATAIFDKRGVGESAGELAGASFEDLAADAVAVARALEVRADVDRVGFFGHSQGGWIGPLAAARWGEAAFVITSAGPTTPPSREAHWDVVRRMRAAGAGPEAERQARTAIDLWHAGLRTADWGPLDDALAQLRGTPWFDRSGLADFAERPDTGFAHSYRAYMDYDPLPVLRTLGVPVMAILAPDDESIDTAETLHILRALIAEGRAIVVKLYPGHDHAMRRLGTGGVPLRWPSQPQDYYDVQAGFILGSVTPPG